MYRSLLFNKSAAAVFGFALLVRVAYNLVVARGYYPLHDSLTYQSIAYGLLREHCYCLHSHLPTVDRAPLWPAIIAGIYGTLGEHDRTVRLFLCIVGATTCLLVYYFAKDLFGRNIGLLAGLLAAVYPFLYIYDGWLYSESLYTLLLTALCYLLYRLQHDPCKSKAILVGVLIGLLALTRPNGITILALFLLWAIINGWTGVLRWHDVAGGAIIVSFVSLLLIAPWTIRNYIATHSFVPIAVGDGKVLLGSYNTMILQRPYYLGTWILPNEATPSIAQRFPPNCAGECEVKRDTTYRSSAGQWIQENQDKLPYLLWLHFANTWQTTTQEADLAINRFPDRYASQFVIAMMKVITPIIFVLATLGLIVTRKRWRDLLFTYFLIMLTIVQCLILYGSARFRAPIEPMLILLASGAMWWLIRQPGRQHRTRKEVTIVVESTEFSQIGEQKIPQ